MPTIRFLAIACFLPLFLAAAALGEKPEATADGAGEVASKKPTLVYYYYDG
jgi:hypothetical protein